MTPAGPVWLQGAGLRSYVLTNAEIALRLLLPPRTTDDGVTTWAAVAREMSHPASIDASTSWTRLAELDGHGAQQPILVEHPGGRTTDLLLTELVTALTLVTGPRARWHYKENPDRAGTQVELAPPGHDGPGRTSTYGPTTLDGSLRDLAEHWEIHGFHGRAWDAMARVGLAADSIIMSGPAPLGPLMTETDLEVFRLALSAPNPTTTS